MDSKRLGKALRRGDDRAVASMLSAELKHGGPVISGEAIHRTKRERDVGQAAHAYREHAAGLVTGLDRILSGQKHHSSVFYDRDDLCECVARVMRMNVPSIARTMTSMRERQAHHQLNDREMWTHAIDGTLDEYHIGFATSRETGRVDTFSTDGIKVILMINPMLIEDQAPLGLSVKTAYPAYDARDADTVVRRGVSHELVRQTDTYKGYDPIGRAMLLERTRPDHMCPIDYDYGHGVTVYGHSTHIHINIDGQMSSGGIPLDDKAIGELGKAEPKLVTEARRLHADFEYERSMGRSYADAPADILDMSEDDLEGPEV